MVNEVRRILATNLERLKIQNPIAFVGVFLVGNLFIWGVNHPDVFTEYTTLAVTDLTKYARDGMVILLTGTSAATFNDLSKTHPKKMAVTGTLEGQKENL